MTRSADVIFRIVGTWQSIEAMNVGAVALIELVYH